MLTLLLLLLMIQLRNAYVFINNKLDWNQAQIFCNQKCDSNLASIHSFLSVSNEYWNTSPTTQVYIGLRYNASNHNNFTWSDRSLFDYGKTFASPPWVASRPSSPLTGHCIGLVAWSKWADMECNTPRYFMCNDCKYDNYNELPTYFLSPIRFDLHNAQTYCIDHCHSDIGSIHNEKDMQLAVYMACNQPKFEHFLRSGWNNEHNVQIGLYRNDSGLVDPMAWLDGSVWDYGNNTSPQAQYPWADQEPDINGAELCTQLRWEYLYIWGDGENICSKTQRFLCNSCDGELNKYMLVTKIDYAEAEMPYSLAESYCNMYLNESLASIHSQYDFKLAQKLCDMAVLQTNENGADCFIGLNAFGNEGVFTYKDGTDFDFGADFNSSIWGENLKPNQAGRDCVELETKSGEAKLEVDNCHSSSQKNFICNVPSLLSNSYMSYWNTIMNDIGVQTVIISNKQWINHNEKLMMDYMFKFVSFNAAGDAYAGIMLFNFNSICSYYYISINPSTNIISLSKTMDTQTVVIDYKAINLPLQLNTYYLLGITILHGTNFVVSMNDVQYINLTDTQSSAFISSSITSGYVAMQNINSEIQSKYLYISGGVFDMSDNYVINDFVLCSSAPTSDPTQYYTMNPSLPADLSATTYSPSTLPTIISSSPSQAAEGSVTDHITTNDVSYNQQELTSVFEKDIFKLLALIIGVLLCVMIILFIIRCHRIKKRKAVHVNQKHMQMTDVDSNDKKLTQIVSVSQTKSEDNELKTLNEDMTMFFALNDDKLQQIGSIHILQEKEATDSDSPKQISMNELGEGDCSNSEELFNEHVTNTGTIGTSGNSKDANTNISSNINNMEDENVEDMYRNNQNKDTMDTITTNSTTKNELDVTDGAQI